MSRTRPARVPARALQYKRLLWVLGGLLALGVLAGVGYAIQTFRQAPAWLDLARKARDARDFPAAEQFYNQYLEQRKNDADARFELAAVYDEHAHASIAHPLDAITLWKRSQEEAYKGLQADGGRHDERRKLAKLSLMIGQPTPARAELEVLLKEPELKNDPELLELLARTEPGTPEGKLRAAGHLRGAVATGKASAETHLRLATFLRLQTSSTPQTKQEADEVMAALVKPPRENDLTARLARYRYLTESDRRLQAAADIKYAYENIPGGRKNIDVILAHADAVAATDLPAARAILKDGVADHPANALLGMGLAEVERRGGNTAAARDQLVAVLNALPPDDALALDVGDRLLDLGDTAAAAAANRAADRLADTPLLAPLADYLRGRGKLLAGDWPAAMPLLRASLLAVGVNRQVKRPEPILQKAWLGLAVGYEQANDPARQIDSLKRASDVDPTFLPARLSLATAYAKMNRMADAERELAAIASSSPAARAALANLKLANAITGKRPEDFWTHVGGRPVGDQKKTYPPELAPAVAAAYAAEGKPAEAEKELVAALDRNPTVPAFVMLAGLKAANPADALAVLDQADKKIGPNADLIVTRGSLMLRLPKPDPAAVAALTVDRAPAADRTRVKMAIGELLLAHDSPQQGLPLLQAVATELKFDLNVRITLFDWALTHKDTALRDTTLAELRTLDADPDGGKGGMVLVAEVMRELADHPQPDAATTRQLSASLAEAGKKRAGWSRVPRMQGILALAEGRSDDARGFFEQAIKLGDRSDALVREVVRMHFAGERYADALRVLETARSKGGLSAELERQYQVLSATASTDPKQGMERVTGSELATSKNPQDHLLRARVFLRLSQQDEAFKAVGRALELAPDLTDAMVFKVRLLAAKGTPATVLRPEIEKVAAELKKKPLPDPAAVPLAIGQMWEAAGDTKQAIAEYAAAVSAAPASREAPQALLALYRKANESAPADALLAKLTAAENPDVRRWARRAKAETLPTADAVKLLDQNIAESSQPEDVRAKGFALCNDPRRRSEGLKLVEESRTNGRLPAADAYRLGLILIEGAKFEAAEAEFKSATADGLLADAGPLAALAQVQTARKQYAAADKTADRMKAVAPNRVETMLEDARRLARSDPSRAAELVLKIPTDAPEARKPLQRAKWLETVGCPDAAEKLYAEYAAGTDPAPVRHAVLVEFLARAGKTDKALAAVREKLNDKAITPELSTRLMMAAVKGSTDPKVIEEVADFVSGRAAAAPASGEWVLRKAEVASLQGNPAAAAKLFADAAKLFPEQSIDRAVATNNAAALAVLTTKEGTPDLLAQADEVLVVVGPRPFALDTRGLVLLGMDKPKEALADLEAAAGSQASPTNLLHLAYCYSKLDRPADAKDAFDRAKLLGLKKTGLPLFDANAYSDLDKK